MKHVFPTHEIPHLWAHQSQIDARNAQGNLYFEGKTIWSYGSHFPIATFAENAKGQTAVLVTTRGYSVTTGGHISAVRRAVHHLSPIFNIPLNGGWTFPQIRGGIQSYRERIDAKSATVSRSRCNQEWAFSSLVALVDEANRFAAFFDFDDRFQVPENLESLRESLKGTLAAKRSEKKTAKLKKLADYADTVSEWQSGLHRFIPRDLGPFLRILGDQVETSLGVLFPVSHAIKGLRFVRAVRESGQPYKRNGHTIHLGHYAIDSIDKRGNVTAGCHKVPWVEIDRIAPQLEAVPVSREVENNQ